MNPLRLACCCLLLVVCVAPAAAQRIASLEILTRTDELGRGPELDHGVLSRLIEARAGIRYTPAMASRDLARFVATGLFSAERSDYWVEPVERGVRLTYALQANPVVSGYEFGRVSGIDQDVLERAASRTYPIGLIFDATKRRYAAEVIRQAFDESDLSADVGLPSVDRTGRVRFPILEHRVRSMETRWIGPPLLSEETLREVLSLDAFGLLRPSALEEGRRRLSASGLLESVDLAVSTPDSLGLVDVRVSLDARSLPAPTSRSAMAFMDPERLPECVVSTKPLGVSVPFDLTPPMGAAESQQRAESDSPQGLLDAVLSFLEMGDYRAASALCDEGVSDRIAAADPWLSARLAAIAGRAVKPLTEERDDLPPLAEARLDFVLAEVEVRHLAEALGVLPDHPASMRDLAAVLAGVEPDLVVDSRAYASAMASATDHMLALEDLDEVRAALPLIEELLVSREYLRRLDRRLPSAPAPLPPFASIAVGNERILQALLTWRRAEPDSPGAAYALGAARPRPGLRRGPGSPPVRRPAPSPWAASRRRPAWRRLSSPESRASPRRVTGRDCGTTALWRSCWPTRGTRPTVASLNCSATRPRSTLRACCTRRSVPRDCLLASPRKYGRKLRRASRQGSRGNPAGAPNSPCWLISGWTISQAPKRPSREPCCPITRTRPAFAL